MRLFDSGKVQTEITDEPLDHLTADQVILIERAAFPLGMTQLCNLCVIGLELFLVLGVGITDHADGGDPQPQQIAITLSGIALEVAVQLALALRHCQLVIGFGKMVHTDELVTLTGQEGDGVLQHGQLLLRRRHIHLFQLALGSKATRQMGIVEDGEARRIRLEHLFQRMVEAGTILMRQAIDKVEVGRAEA